MKLDAACAACQAALEVEVILEPAEAIEAGSDPVRDESAEELAVHCPQCGALVNLIVPPGTEDVAVRVKAST
jgi:uncharacterized Zn finger protein